MDTEKVKKGLFQNVELEEQLFDKGYIVLPFFSEEQVAQLKHFYSTVHPGTAVSTDGRLHGIHMTTWASNQGYKLLVGEFIRHIFDKACQKWFRNHRHLNHVFIAKEPGTETEFDVHQDWSVVDENQHYSVNIWCPMHDVSKENGALWILPGSHRLDQPIRGAGYLFPNYHQEMDTLKDHVQCIDVKAGEALIFFHSTIHGSPPNNSSENRVVACCTVIDEDAPLRTYYQNGESDPLSVYQPKDDFMYGYRDIMNESVSRPPLGKLIETREPYKLNKVELDDLIGLCQPG